MNIHRIINAPEGTPHSLVVNVSNVLLKAIVQAFHRRNIDAMVYGDGRFIVACESPKAKDIINNQLALKATIGSDVQITLPKHVARQP